MTITVERTRRGGRVYWQLVDGKGHIHSAPIRERDRAERQADALNARLAAPQPRQVGDRVRVRTGGKQVGGTVVEVAERTALVSLDETWANGEPMTLRVSLAGLKDEEGTER